MLKKGDVMAQQCPLIFRQVDATVTRINTLFIIAGVIGFMITDYSIILVFLTIDFLLRLYGYKHISPIHNISLLIQQKFSFKKKMEDAGAKRLAAFFGLGFTVALIIFHIIGVPLVVNLIAFLYLFCAALELFFGYCIACKLYYIVKKVYPKGFI
jgi:hypothetical protein